MIVLDNNGTSPYDIYRSVISDINSKNFQPDIIKGFLNQMIDSVRKYRIKFMDLDKNDATEIKDSYNGDDMVKFIDILNEKFLNYKEQPIYNEKLYYNVYDNSYSDSFIENESLLLATVNIESFIPSNLNIGSVKC